MIRKHVYFISYCSTVNQLGNIAQIFSSTVLDLDYIIMSEDHIEKVEGVLMDNLGLYATYVHILFFHHLEEKVVDSE